MPQFRDDLARIAAYRPGARTSSAAEAIRLAANECPHPPFPEVQEAIAAEIAGLNRYPDNDAADLRRALATAQGIPADHLWFGAGSNTLLSATTIAVGGPGTSVVFADPSFALYRPAAVLAGSEPIGVPLDADHRHDLDSMAAAVRSGTRLVFVCNPNNPTGTHVGGDDLAGFVDEVGGGRLVAVDEAYAEFATADDFRSMIPLAVERDDVVVYRTFSKIYGLAGLRLGYAVARPDVIAELRKVSPPFSASSLAQVAARTALRFPERIAGRRAEVATGRRRLLDALAERRVPAADSQANFVYCRPGPGAYDALATGGVLTRGQPDGWLRVTVGTGAENDAFLDALDRWLEERPREA